MSAWDPYLDLDTGVLTNKLGIRDRSTLAQVEAELSAYRITELQREPLVGDLDFPHLRGVHRYILQDIYDWAGEIRTVSMGKGGQMFCPPLNILPRATAIFSRLAAERHLQGRDRPEFLDGLTRLLAEINALHPFREGNGRAQRAFLSQLAAHAGYRLAWRSMDPDDNRTACRAAHTGDLAPMRRLLEPLVTRDTGGAQIPGPRES